MLSLDVVDPYAFLSFILIMPVALVLGLVAANKIIAKDKDETK